MPLQAVLAIYAHPDDETIFTAGTLALLHAHGVQTHLACATRGEGGEAGEPPVVADRAHLGAARQAELQCAAAVLGLTSLHFLGYVDPDIGPGGVLNPFAADFETLTAQIAARIADARADAILTHGPDGEYGHPAHQLIHRAVMAALRQAAPGLPCYSVAASLPEGEDRIWNKSRRAHLALDISPWAEAKLAAMACHVSQHALFKRRRGLLNIHDALRRMETFYREWPDCAEAAPTDDFATLLRACGAQDIPRT